MNIKLRNREKVEILHLLNLIVGKQTTNPINFFNNWQQSTGLSVCLRGRAKVLISLLQIILIVDGSLLSPRELQHPT